MAPHIYDMTLKASGFGDPQTPVFCIQLSAPGLMGAYLLQKFRILYGLGSFSAVLITEELAV